MIKILTLLQNPADRPNFRTILHMLRKMGGELPPQAPHGVYFSRDNFHRFLHGERSCHPGTPMPPNHHNSGIPPLSEMTSMPGRHFLSTPSATSTPTRAAAAGMPVSAPATPRRWDGGGSARQGDTIVI
jgi:hypothetical protein